MFSGTLRRGAFFKGGEWFRAKVFVLLAGGDCFFLSPPERLRRNSSTRMEKKTPAKGTGA
jgi:hypothetical protein